MNEIWKDVKNYEGLYQISNLGRIKSLARPYYKTRIKHTRLHKEKFLTPSQNNCGYLIISLYKNNSKKTFSVHRLVADHFLSNPFFFPEVHHKNNIKLDNQSKNLEWISKEDHDKQTTEDGLKIKGEKHKGSKITSSQVIEIREKYLSKQYSLKELSKIYQLSKGHIHAIATKKCWKHI